MIYATADITDVSGVLPRSWMWGESPETCWVARDSGGVICSCFLVFTRVLYYGPINLDVGAIGGLFTVESYRGMGLASKLLEYGIENEDRGFGGFIANSRRENCVFSRVGFKSLGSSISRKGQDLYWYPTTVRLLSPADWGLNISDHF